MGVAVTVYPVLKSVISCSPRKAGVGFSAEKESTFPTRGKQRFSWDLFSSYLLLHLPRANSFSPLSISSGLRFPR